MVAIYTIGLQGNPELHRLFLVHPDGGIHEVRGQRERMQVGWGSVGRPVHPGQELREWNLGTCATKGW